MISQKILNPLGNLLVKKRYKGRVNPFDAFKKIKEGVELPPITKGSIFVGPIRMSGYAHLFEGYLAFAYRMKGYKVYAVLCGQGLNTCESKGLRSIDNLKCSICYAEQIEFCNTFEIEPLWIGEHISTKNKEDIDRSIDSMSFEKMVYKEKDFKGMVDSGLMRVLKVSKVIPSQMPLLRKFARTAMTTYQASLNMLQKIKPEHVILSHGVYSTWGPLLNACQKENIHSVVWGKGYIGNGNLILSHDETYLYTNIVEDQSTFAHIELTEQEKEKTLAYYDEKRNPKSKVDYVNYYAKINPNNIEVDVVEELGLEPEKSVFGMFPNVPWDGQLWSSSKEFPTIHSFISRTIEWFKENPDNILVIRAHPAELHPLHAGNLETFKDILDELYPELPSNVIYLPPNHKITSYQLEKHIKGALLFAGTIGLEFALNGTLVIQTGNNSSSNKGCVLEPKSLEEYHTYLNEISSGQKLMSKEMQLNALKYGHHYIFRKHIPEEILDSAGGTGFKGFILTSAQELENHPIVDWIIEHIDNLEPFVYKS